jgi:hypothetical protein
MKNQEAGTHWAPVAILKAIANGDINHYPRFRDESGKVRTLSVQAIREIISKELDGLKGNPDALKSYLDRGRETLDEVQELTEYQDQKATRLLTIVTFLSALAGVLFTRLAEAYPLRIIWSHTEGFLKITLLTTAYGLFALFVLSAICGALVIFHATKFKFTYPPAEPEQPGRRLTRPHSYLFYSSIIEVTPAAWAKSFVTPATNGQVGLEPDPDISANYLKNYILESYLIAVKVADKLRFLEPGQSILSFAIKVLLFWFLSVGATLVIIPSKDELKLQTSQVGVQSTVSERPNLPTLVNPIAGAPLVAPSTNPKKGN